MTNGCIVYFGKFALGYVEDQVVLNFSIVMFILLLILMILLLNMTENCKNSLQSVVLQTEEIFQP